ncbi:chemoreceptor glutamine deamidase CheD [Aestuariibacter salexigens]|uniref:chemoreceptor glutamine deamidase CheD n=1 Tax=Aestuariibacter salexigens TaxID=226010 RepID=UPI0005516A59|nr:chemoreceptor glutamine deamidase CheD [Aestuariibacter salexigens]
MSAIPPCLPGFEHINRFMDRQLHLPTAKILPGEFYVTGRHELITTVLGSCVSACIYDEKNHVGGMNHFMLPQQNTAKIDVTSESFRFGDVAMERLINEVIKAGGEKRHLKFKAFGGGQIIKKMTSIGESNIEFLKKFMALEGFSLLASDLGGRHPRKVRFDPLSGKVWVKKLEHLHNDTISQREVSYQKALEKQEESYGDVDLFE